MDTNIIGTITEMKCKTYFLELGYTVSTPDSPCRYDFILDTGKELLKIQVKSSNTTRREGCISFSVASCHIANKKHIRADYQNDGIDYFCTYYDNECYLVPVSECGKTEKALRLIPTVNGQTKNISFAKDYIAKEVLKNR